HPPVSARHDGPGNSRPSIAGGAPCSGYLPGYARLTGDLSDSRRRSVLERGGVMGRGHLVALAAAVVALAVPDVASASVADSGGTERAGFAPVSPRLRLTVAEGESATPAQRRASLTCEPPGGTHPRPRPACAALARVGGDFAALHVNGGMC